MTSRNRGAIGDRDRAVCALAGMGWADRDIASAFGLSADAVRRIAHRHLAPGLPRSEIDEIGFSVRTRKRIAVLGIVTLAELRSRLDEMFVVEGVGRKSRNEIRDVLGIPREEWE